MTEAADIVRTPDEVAAPADTAAAQTSAPADTSPGGDLDNALAEFAAATSKPAVPTLDDFFSEPSPDNVDALLRQDGTAADTVRRANEIEALRGSGLAAELRSHELQQRGERLEQAVVELQQREWHRQEKADFQNFVREANEGLSEFRHLPPDFAERWLMSESLKDEKLRAFWDHRHNQQLDAGTRGAINRYLKGALQRLWQSAREMPDPEATADYHAVAAAMKSGQGKRDAPEPPPNLSRMTDSELNRWSQANVGFLAISR